MIGDFLAMEEAFCANVLKHHLRAFNHAGVWALLEAPAFLEVSTKVVAWALIGGISLCGMRGRGGAYINAVLPWETVGRPETAGGGF